ncbi:mucin-17 isoform X1 [Carcharodon carcharias]|uniref:mucin-17 isoform X1 n=1 Tax=Carcharodon carcharias TaxID=13397 RepID=UPI001B7EE67A|nr:mucin-17 isoform X1 [Carcharodon carcharias]
MNQSRTKLNSQPALDSSERPWGTDSNSEQLPLLTSTWTVEPAEMNTSEEDMDTRNDANTRPVSISLGGPKSPLKISGDLVTSISPNTDQASTTQSAGTMPPMAFKIPSVTASISGDEVSNDQWRSSQQGRSCTHGITLSADPEIELVTRPQSWDEVKVPVTSTPAHDLSAHLSILADEGIVEIFPGSGSVNRVERSSTASDTAWTESQDQNSLPGVPANPSELITPHSEQGRKQESESDQHTLFFSQTTDISELLSTQNVNTQNLVNSFKMDPVVGAVNQLETTHWTLDFKGTSSDFDGSITSTLNQVMIKSVSNSGNMFEVPELMTHSSNLPVQEGAKKDTTTLSYESGPSGSECLPEILPTVASLSSAITTQSARSQFPVTDKNALTTQGELFTNRILSSISLTPGMTFAANSVDGSGGEMVSSEVTEDSGGVTGRGSEILSTRDTPVEGDGNVTLLTFTKDGTTKVMATHSQRLEVTPRAKSSSGISVIFDLPGTEKNGNRMNTLHDSTIEMMVTVEPSGKTTWFEGGTSSPSNSGGKNTGGSQTEGNIVYGDRVPSFSPRTPAPEPITPQPPASVSPTSVEVDHSASPPKEIFPTTLSLTWLPERSSTDLEASPSLSSTRGTIAPTLSKTKMPRSDNPISSSGRTTEAQTSAGERLRETLTSVMNQTFQKVTEMNRSVIASGTPSFTPGSLDQAQPDTRPPTSPLLPVLTDSVVSVTNLAQLLPSISTFETASQPSSDQTGTGSSQTFGSSSATSGVSDRGEPTWPTTIDLKITVPPPPAFSSAEEEEKLVTSEETTLSWMLRVNQLGSQPNDGSPVTHVGTKDLNSNVSQSAKPTGNKQWQREILSTLAAAHSATTEGFWTWGQSDLGTLSTGHGVVPTSGSSASPEGATSLPAVTIIAKSVITHRIPTTPTPRRSDSWTLGKVDTSPNSPTPGLGMLISLTPTSQPLHSHINPTPSERAVQTTMHQPTLGTLRELMNSVPSSTPTEKRKQIFIVGNKLPLIKEGVTVKIPTKLILDKNFTVQLEDSTSEEYQNLAKDFTHKVSPFYKKLPGFKQLLVKYFSAGSVLIEFDVVFIAKEIQAYLLDPNSIFNVTGLYNAILGGFEIDRARVLRVYVSEDFIALCGEVFSCQTGFQCIHSDTKNVSCTSLCHVGYCKNSGICTHNQGQGPICQCPVGIDYWFMGPRCDHRMTRQNLIGIALGVVLSLLVVITAVAIAILRRFKVLLIEAKIDQTKSSYKRFSRFDDFSNQYQSQSWLNYSVSSLDNPGFSNSDELIHLQMLDSSYYSCHEESVTGTYSSWRTAPHDRSTFRHSLQNNLDVSINSINEHAGDSGKASDLSVYSWPIEPLQWSPFPILYQLSRDRPFKARRPRSYCEGMELVSMERNWTA